MNIEVVYYDGQHDYEKDAVLRELAKKHCGEIQHIGCWVHHSMEIAFTTQNQLLQFDSDLPLWVRAYSLNTGSLYGKDDAEHIYGLRFSDAGKAFIKSPEFQQQLLLILANKEALVAVIVWAATGHGTSSLPVNDETLTNFSAFIRNHAADVQALLAELTG